MTACCFRARFTTSSRPSIATRPTSCISKTVATPCSPRTLSLVPNLLQEFNLDPMLAMIHGDGASHAWVDVAHVREALRRFPRPVGDYRALFTLLTDAGFHVKKIGYISFRSAIGT